MTLSPGVVESLFAEQFGDRNALADGYVPHSAQPSTLSGQMAATDVLQAAARRRSPAIRDATDRIIAARVLLDRLARMRRDTGRQLLGGAEVAFAEALRHAGVRAVNKARNRKGQAWARTLAAAYEAHQSLVPFFAALGVTEQDLLSGAFQSYSKQAQAWLIRRRQDIRLAVERDDVDHTDVEYIVPGNDTTIEAAAAFLGLSLLAMARQRILAGQDQVTADMPGEVSGAVPATVIASAMRIADGEATYTPGESPDDMPTVVSTPGMVLPVEVRVAADLSDGLLDTLSGALSITTGEQEAVQGAIDRVNDGLTEYLWVHGYYGDPMKDFPAHLALGNEGFTTTDPEGDERLAWNEGDDWLDNENGLYQPGDHRGCTCEWVSQIAGGIEDITIGALERVQHEGPIPGITPVPVYTEAEQRAFAGRVIRPGTERFDELSRYLRGE